jgi:NADH-quinone oxidoreductase subunit J
MDAKTLLFLIFSSVLLAAAFRVVTARNPVHAVLFLVLAFVSAACLWMLLKAEFLAIVLVLVYVGAVMVLFLFVVMMLDINVDRLRTGFWQHFPVAAAVGVAIALQLWLVLTHGGWQFMTEGGTSMPRGPNIEALGLLMFTEYVYPLQIAGTILLVAMIAAIALTLRRRKDSKRQRPGDQVRVQRADRVRMVSMPADNEARQTGSAGKTQGEENP